LLGNKGTSFVQGDSGVAAGENAAGARGAGPGVQHPGQENRDAQPPGGNPPCACASYNLCSGSTSVGFKIIRRLQKSLIRHGNIH